MFLVQLCLPLTGPGYFSEFVSTVDANHAGFFCTHVDADAGHEHQDTHQQIAHCHELDAPCDTATAFILDHSPVMSRLTSINKGVLLAGYGALIDIPPENRV